jgi:hypothetical protein
MERAADDLAAEERIERRAAFLSELKKVRRGESLSNLDGGAGGDARKALHDALRSGLLWRQCPQGHQ